MRSCRDCPTLLPASEPYRRLCDTCRVEVNRRRYRTRIKLRRPAPPMAHHVVGRRATARERFEVKVHADRSGCLEWIGATTGTGYGQFWDGERLVRAHRWAYEQQHGPIPADLQVDHLCGNRGCVRVDHLEAVTNRENCARARARWAVA